MYCLDNQDVLIRRKIPLLISLNSDTLSSYLTPILAQFGIKYTDFLAIFIKEFEIFSNNIFTDLFIKDILLVDIKKLSTYDLIIRTTIILDYSGKYVLEFERPSISFMILYFLRKRYRRIRK